MVHSIPANNMNIPKLTGQRSLCAACRELFRSVAAFDKHRTGKHGVDRRCRTVAEMTERGMVRNARGDWTTGARILNRPQPSWCDFPNCAPSCWKRCSTSQGRWDGEPTHLHRDAWMQAKSRVAA